MSGRTIQDLGEDGLLDRIRKIIPPVPKNVVGIGDDAAVLDGQLWTTDTLVENVHFRCEWCSPEELGYKALAVNLSDIAAMGGTPRAALVSLILPPQTAIETVLRLYVGMSRLARTAKAAIVGGNLARGFPLSVTVALSGEVRGKPILRSGARPGDRLFVSGQPGLARLGYLILERELPRAKDAWSEPKAQFMRRRKQAAAAYPGGYAAIKKFLLP